MTLDVFCVASEQQISQSTAERDDEEAMTAQWTDESDAERDDSEIISRETAEAQQKIPEAQADASLDEESDHLDFFAHPQPQDLEVFFSYHPQQPTKHPLLAKVFHSKHGTNRKWLTYSEKTQSLYCSVCLAFAPAASDSPFIKGGMKTWKHVHQRIEEHEKSKIHRDSADAYFLLAQRADVKSLLAGKQMSLHHEQVKKKRQVMERIVDVIKVIGKCGLSYRGDKAEAAYTLENTAVNHGNFLELMTLLSRYDLCLQQHMSSCIEQSRRHHDTGAKGRGSLVTLLSKDIVGKVVDVLSQVIKGKIADEVREAGMFSVQIDTTQDVTSKDQCAVIVRYVTNAIHEQLVAVVDCEKSTGKYLTELLKHTLEKLNIDIGTCVGNSTDGAANMQGQYKGFSAFLSEQSPTQIYVWCYAHVLNLVLADTTGSVIESASLFSLLNEVAVFLRESYKRMQRWEETSEDKRH
uniref:Uncharacterized protein n=1 Tax=Sparus aurata TaxID=8175 RepID=A0A671TTT5_SPAAU